MSKIYERNCECCDKFYKGVGKRFCSVRCFSKSLLWLKNYQFKKGNTKWNNPNNEKTRFKNKEKNVRWRGGITSLNQKIRDSFEYKLWRKSVFGRDNYACIWCGSKKQIEADHIKPFAYFPELRFAIDNGRTLCRECHEKTDTYRMN